MKNVRQGFTLIELMVVMAIISILAVSVFVALNPSKRIKDALDARRTTDISSILTAIHQYIVDNKGAFPTGLTAGMSEKQLGTVTSGCAISSGGCNITGSGDCINLSTPLVSYLKSIPIDPAGGSAALTNYSVGVDTYGIITVTACKADTPPITVSR